jgi:hypothetical protein
MVDLILGIVAALIASAVFTIGLRYHKQINDTKPFSRIHGFSKDERVVIVFPGRQSNPSSGLLKDRLVTFEDMLAVNYVERILTLSGWKDDLIDFRENHSFEKLDVHDPAKNVVLICSPRSNSVTRKYLDLIKENASLDWDFEVDADGHMSISAGGGRWVSASYSQEETLRRDDLSIEESTIDDIAAVIRTDNPFNPATKVLIVAGIRGVGTWGAAKYLRQHAKDLVRRTGGKDFACLLKVRYTNWRIDKTEMTDVCRILD